MVARFDENQGMTLQDIKETNRYGRTHGRTDNVKTVYPPQTKFAGGGGVKQKKKEENKAMNLQNNQYISCILSFTSKLFYSVLNVIFRILKISILNVSLP